MPTRMLCILLYVSVAAAQPSGAGVKPSAPSVKQCQDMLDESLQDKNPDIRKQAVIALSLAASREPFLKRLESMLEDKDVQVRLAVISSLVDLRSRSAIPILRKALHDEVPEVSFAAAKALWTFRDPAGKEALLAILEGETKTGSNFLTKHMRETLRMVHTPKTMFLFALTEGVGFAPVPGLGTGVSSMQGLLSDPSVSGRATAALLIGRERDGKTLQALRDALADKDWSVRAAAVHAMALHNDPALKADMIPLLDDKKEGVRLRAAAAYLRLQGLHAPSAHNLHAPSAHNLHAPSPHK